MKDDLPPIGTILRGLRDGRPVIAELVLDPDGNPAVLMESRFYPSLSLAAEAATGTKKDGLAFWRDARHRRLPQPRRPKADADGQVGRAPNG